ncbi:actin-binding LIM protein 3-like [Actinia tenebrosa]|uniref:Actin-binding LIM protein 3-like n=1 Tax=Actinia tenebrosa TaxID=6105 RepID=A0A6P8IJP9_ACTTE|nr:actin-binding LIM protein 3-like [Actinia tenebrosa]
MGEADIFCWKCRKPCSGEILKFNDHIFHSDCLTCRVCNCLLKSQPIFDYEDHYYCGDDYHRNYGQKCHACKQFIEGEAVAVHGNVYHDSCFVCGYCRQPFPNGEKIAYDGKDYKCQKCVNTPRKSPSPRPAHSPQPLHRCAGCDEEIKGNQALLALNKQWHLWCFTCTRCHTLLSGEYMGKEGKPYCEKDYQELFGVRCAGCQGYITGKVLQAGDKHYHPSCSRCARCHKVFGEGEEMYLQGNEIWHPRCSDEAALEQKQLNARPFKDQIILAPQTVSQTHSAPEPPARTASHNAWNNVYKGTAPPEEEAPPRETKSRPYSYHEYSSAAKSYGSRDNPPPSSEKPAHRSDIQVPLDIKGAPRVRRYSTEDKDKLMQRDSSYHEMSYNNIDGQPQPDRYYRYSELMTSNYQLPKGVDKTMLETYLTPEEFQKVFSMPREEFYKLPQWKQNQYKKKALLF